MILRFILFLIINFGALALGGLFTGQGVPSEWYQTLNKAPWTPPGWVFGAAWTTIMLLLTFYMTSALAKTKQKKTLLVLFTIQWILNVGWNPVFFMHHELFLGLVIIVALTILVAVILFRFYADMKHLSWLLLPYLLWLVIATSLNAYAWLMN